MRSELRSWDCGPLPLLHIDEESGDVVSHPESLELLRSLSYPVLFASCIGLPRTGKSSLLNFLSHLLVEDLGTPDSFDEGFESCDEGPLESFIEDTLDLLDEVSCYEGSTLQPSCGGGATCHRFPVSSGMEPCTRGLWMTCLPILLTCPKAGTPFHVAVIDTQGIEYSGGEGAFELACLQSFAIQLSSIVLLNQVGIITESSLESLTLISSMGGVAGGATQCQPAAPREHEESQVLSTDDARLPEKTLFLVLRDATLEDDGTMDSILELQSPGPDQHEALEAPATRVRRFLATQFPHRRKFAIPSPATDRQTLCRLDTLGLAAASEKFREGLSALASALKETAAVSSAEGGVCSGVDAADAVAHFLDSTEELRRLEARMISEAENKRVCMEAVRQAVQEYERLLASPSTDNVDREQLHQEAASGATELYVKLAEGRGVWALDGKVMLDSKIGHFFEMLEAPAGGRAEEHLGSSDEQVTEVGGEWTLWKSATAVFGSFAVAMYCRSKSVKPGGMTPQGLQD